MTEKQVQKSNIDMSDEEGTFEPPTITIGFLNSERQQLSLKVEWDMTIEQVKSLIAKTTGIDPKFQRLLYDLNYLDDEMKLSQTRVEVGHHLNCIISTVQAKKRPRPPAETASSSSKMKARDSDIEIQQEDQSNELVLKENASVVKSRAKGSVAEALDMFRIFIIFMSGETIVLDVKPTETILQAMEKIQKKCHIPTELQTLLFKDNVLDINRTFSEYGIERYDGLSLVITEPSYELDLWIDLRRVVLDVKGTHTLDDLKLMIQEKEGIPVEFQRFKRTYGFVEDTSQTLAELNIIGECAQVQLCDSRRP
jgi:hypothetical protein